MTEKQKLIFEAASRILAASVDSRSGEISMKTADAVDKARDLCGTVLEKVPGHA